MSGALASTPGTIATAPVAPRTAILQTVGMDHGEWRERHPRRGWQLPAISFTRKTGQGVGGAAGAFAIGLGGYVFRRDRPERRARESISVAAGAVPSVILAATAIMSPTREP